MLDSIVKRLRKALEIDPNHPAYILTVRGIGFRLADSAGPE
jgi:DNA-binding response OmpR family regulator